MIANPEQVLGAWPALAGGRVEPLGNGLINDTFLVQAAAGRFVLQRVNPIFGAQVQHDIEAVTAHLAARGLETPRLLGTGAGHPFVQRDGHVWRVLTWVEGQVFDRARDPTQARAAGALLARFHSALADLDHEFKSTRLGVHDTPAHLTRLAAAVDELGGHRLHGVAAALAAEIIAAARALPTVGQVPQRVVHGDPKLNNMLFDPRDPNAGVCMVDLDTCARMGLHLELGDAWRSWCNLTGEDGDGAQFDLDLYRASWSGYREACELTLSDDEREALVHGVEWITLELSARFLADALREDYFGWDPQRYPARGEHNLARARGQWALHGSVVKCRAARRRVL